MGEGDQLQVDVIFHCFAHVEQGFDPQEAVVAGVDVAADRQKAKRGGPVAVFQRAGFDHILGHDLFEFAPEADAFEESTGGVDARGAVAERGVHVEMRVDEGRADEVSAGVDGFSGLSGGEVFDGGDLVALDADVGGAAVGECAAFDDNVEHGVVLMTAGLKTTKDSSRPRVGVKAPAVTPKVCHWQNGGGRGLSGPAAGLKV